MAAALVSPVPRLLLADVTAYIPAVGDRPIPPDSRFGATSTAEDVTAGLDLSGITALVTGCNSGLGLETMRVLAMHGAHVIGAARTQEKAEAACASVYGKTTPLVIELTDFTGIVNASNEVKAMAQSLDMLILNAGIMALPELEQVYGLEKQFVVNHLGHFILASRLRDLVVLMWCPIMKGFCCSTFFSVRNFFCKIFVLLLAILGWPLWPFSLSFFCRR